LQLIHLCYSAILLGQVRTNIYIINENENKDPSARQNYASERRNREDTCFINLGRNTAIDAFFEGILKEIPGGFAVKSFSYIHSKHFDIVS